MPRKILVNTLKIAKEFQPLQLVTFFKQELSPILIQKVPHLSLPYLSNKTIEKVNRTKGTAAYLSAVSLAAKQVNYQLNFFVMNTKPISNNWISEQYTGKQQYQCYINPKILSADKQNVTIHEQQCLSFPFFKFLIPRYNKIIVQYSTVNKQKKQQQISGFKSIVFQHNLDHLKSRLSIDWRLNRGEIQLQQNVKIHFPKTNDILQEYSKNIKQALGKFPEIHKNMTVQNMNNFGCQGQILSFQIDTLNRIAKHYRKQFALFVERLNNNLIKY